MNVKHQLIENLEKDKFDYVLITLKYGKDKTNAEVFYHIKNKKKIDEAIFVLLGAIKQMRSEK
ncbi:MAG: hypothetical protein AABY22_02280 [Nanoarchaeota archaeon]